MHPTVWTAKRRMCWDRAGRLGKAAAGHHTVACNGARMTTRSPEMRAIAKTLLFVLAFLAMAVAHAAAQVTTVVLVRHAEKLDSSADPVLSEAGTARALSLVDALKAHNIGAVFTTQ